MCGISAVVTLTKASANGHPSEQEEKRSKDVLQQEMIKSLDFIKHRGPDAKGIWVSLDQSIGMESPKLQIP